MSQKGLHVQLQVIINVGKETASMQAHLVSLENKHNADQLQQQYQRKVKEHNHFYKIHKHGLFSWKYIKRFIFV